MYLLLFFIITLLGIVLRLSNLSPFYIYPDSYVSQVVSQNITRYHQVIGRLGDQGMFYPDFISWTRPVYPIFISLFHSALLVSFVFSLASIIVVYFLFKNIFKSTLTALSASLLLSLSFNHIVWSGFILSESTGVFFILLFLYFFLTNISGPALLSDPLDLAAGAVFALAVMTRYEYFALIIPLIIYIFMATPAPLIKTINIFTSFILVISLFISLLFPSPLLLFQSLLAQTRDSWRLLIFPLLIIPLVFIFNITKILNHLMFFILLLITLTSFFSLLPISSVHNFIITDFLIGITFFAGSFFMLKLPYFRPLLFFCFLSVLILGSIYLQLNLDMLRYLTHLLPFLLIPSSFFLSFSLKSKFPLAIGICLIILLQTYISYKGLKSWQGGIWFKQDNYAKIITQRISGIINSPHSILMVSLPEPYYLATFKNVYSTSGKNPFIYIDSSLDSWLVVIIEDAGMYYYFPEFSCFIDTYLSSYQTASFTTGQPFFTQSQQIKETQPVKIYVISLADLKGLIRDSPQINETSCSNSLLQRGKNSPSSRP